MINPPMTHTATSHLARPVVTIGLPTSNRAGTYLREALHSAIAQTYPSIEIVVSDNNSIDDTEAVVRSFQDPRIRYVRHDRHLAPNENFNSCLAQATGDYFLLLHDDDVIDPDFVEVCMRAVDYRTDFGVIRTGTRIIDSQGDVLRELPNGVGGLPTVEFFRGWFAHETALYFCSTVFNTVWLREAGGFASPRFVFQDAFAIVKLAATFRRADVREAKASFRRHPSGRTFSTKVSDWCEDSLALLDVMLALVSDRKGIVRNEGLHFFARLNYGRAAEARSLSGRLAGYLVVFKRFNYRYAPSGARLYQLFKGTPLFSAMRFAKRKVRHALSAS